VHHSYKPKSDLRQANDLQALINSF